MRLRSFNVQIAGNNSSSVELARDVIERFLQELVDKAVYGASVIVKEVQDISVE